MNKKRLIITSLISIILVSILFVGTTYSIFVTEEIDPNTNVYTTGNLDITYTLSENNVKIISKEPVSEEDVIKLKPYRLIISNVGNVPYKFDIVLNDTTATNVIDYNYIMTKVGKLESKALGNCENNIIKSDIIVPANDSVIIDIRVYLSEEITNSEMGKSFYANLSIDGIAIYNDNETIDNSVLVAKYTPYAIDVIKEEAVPDNIRSTYVSSDSGIDFSNISSDTNGKGVYMLSSTKDDTYPIYYYRGAVENNNILFANFCWKMVRTTETGGVKLIYNGTPTNGKCNNTGEASQIGESAFNSIYDSPAYVGYMYVDKYPYRSKLMSSVTDTYYYGNDVTYSNETYTLTNTISSNSWSDIYNGGLNNYHYTCLSTSTTCSSVYYIYYTTSNIAYYITLTNGKKIEDALNEMLTNSTNSTNSTIKTTIDTWYGNNLTSYTDKLEDTVWCNDRSIGVLNGWDPNGGSTRSYLYFLPYTRNVTNKKPSLTCINTVDRFTVNSSNGNKKLTYPVGLLTVDEMALAGGKVGTSNSNYYLYTGVWYWSASPCGFYYDYTFGFGLYSNGGSYDFEVDFSFGVRPSVSLRPGITFTSGTGTVDDPYVVE